jgi:methanogenic corrinoid protein MtbC1
MSAGSEMVEALISDGVDLETIYINLLAPAARRMGELWENDERDFSDVTIGLCRLHELLRAHKLEDPSYETISNSNNASILLTTACEDQHIFGVIMVAEFFRKAGWLVNMEPGTSLAEMERIIAKQHYDVLGLSLARDLSTEEISKEISSLRLASKNKDLKVIIGGGSIERNISIVREFGADSYSTDASKAPEAARSLLADSALNC